MPFFEKKDKVEWEYDTGLITRIVGERNKLTIYFSYWRYEERKSPVVHFTKALQTHILFYIQGGVTKKKWVDDTGRFTDANPMNDSTLYLIGNHMPYNKHEFHDARLFSKTPLEQRIDHIHICTKNKFFSSEELEEIFHIANAYQKSSGCFDEVKRAYTV